VEQEAGDLRLLDVAREGSALVAPYSALSAMRALPPGETAERDLSWLDWSLAADLSEDGRMLLFTEEGDGVGGIYTVYLRKTDGSLAVRLGEGWAQELSPDGKWALSVVQHPEPAKLMLLPTGAGNPREVAGPSINHRRATWFPDGKRILFSGKEPGKRLRLYVQDPSEGLPKAVTPEGVSLSWMPRPISPDGKWVAALSDQMLSLYPLDGGEPRPVPGQLRGEVPSRWSADGRWLYLFHHNEVPKKVYRVEISTGRRELLRELVPADAVGVNMIFPVLLTPDGRSYAYSYSSSLNNLYLVKGLK
jgi:Tol biopolymer transport system component